MIKFISSQNLSHFPERKDPPQNYFGKERRSFQPPQGAAALKFDYRKSIEFQSLPATTHGYQCESRFRNRGSGAFLDTTGPGHKDLFPKHEGAGPGYFEQKHLHLVSLNQGKGFTIPESERFVGPTALNGDRDKSVPGPAAYDMQNRTQKGFTLGTGMDRTASSATFPRAQKKPFTEAISDTPGPSNYHLKSPRLTGLAGAFARERQQQEVKLAKIPKMEGIFGLGC